MASIGRELKTKGVIMTLLSLVLMNIGCEDTIDNPAVNPSEGKTVEVALNIGFADEADGYNLSASTKAISSEKGAIDMELIPLVATRTATTAHPDQLYKLEIRQYKQDGTYLNGSGPADQTIGQKLTVNLTQATNCQLVFVAWGYGSNQSLGTVNLSKAQEIAIDADKINNISTNDIKAMPYVLHLKHVNVTGSNANGIISNPDGQDVRILLKRLATRLTISWHYNVIDYTLKQIILQSIPLNYKVIAAPDEKENNTYPSLLDQYTNIVLGETEMKDKNSYSCWIPANVRGFNTASNSPLYRIKANAPTGSAYASFIAVNNNDLKKKFNYRVYLGGKDYSDFNLYGNTDYNYTVTINHDGIPTNDRRVTYIDPIPASENNENFVNTANCFMVAPGSYFNFNPYKYYVNGKVTDNTLLQTWCQSSKIKSVKVLWQTLENGDLGDPVLGTANSSDDHTNIVDIKNGDDFETARIYCRVAPNTTGGSGAIAAYDQADGKGNILWSWHIWVTDYSPDATGDVDVQEPINKRKQKYTHGIATGNGQLPMMDRNLGAMAGYITVPESELERSKTNGFHYQWGRKDPFRSSYSNKIISTITVETIDKPTVGLLSLYKEDGTTFFPMNITSNKTDYQTAYQHPQNIYKDKITTNDGKRTWITSINEEYQKSWDNNNQKGVHDPCPAGWWVASKVNYQPLFTNTSYNSLNLKNQNISADGGVLVSYDKEKNSCTYLKLTGYWIYFNQFGGIGSQALFWNRERVAGDTGSKGFHFRFDLNGNTSVTPQITGSGWEQEALLIRCIQERE